MPRKNVRLLAGIPLIVHSIRAAFAAGATDRVFVITDDDEIAAIAEGEGVRVLREPQTTGRATLDDVAKYALDAVASWGGQEEDIFLTLQPTCPFIRAERVKQAVTAFDTGAGSIITVFDDRHLGWLIGADGEPEPNYTRRLNRQELPPHFRESGAIIGTLVKNLRARGTRIVEPIRLIEVAPDEALDIDTFSDWVVAEHLASRRRVLIRTNASEILGMGHAYRTLAVAQELARHEVLIAIDCDKPLGKRFFASYPFETVEVAGEAGFVGLVRKSAPDLVILDQLDTSREFVLAVKSAAAAVVTFEDLGPGASEADLVVSDLYENLEVPAERQFTGIANAILAPNFETTPDAPPFGERVENILVAFGGTDPARLAEKALDALALLGCKATASVVRGLGAMPVGALEARGLTGEILSDVRHMPSVMANANLALSSAGRTVTELVTLGVPVLCMCQNEKELTHTHACARFGVINLGLGEFVDTGSLAAHIRHLIDAPALRRTLRTRALHETTCRSNAAIIQRITRTIGWE